MAQHTANPVQLTDTGTALDISAAGVDLARYVYRPDTVQFESPKPYLHPLRTPAGRVVSLYRPHDHVWHKGIAWTVANINSYEHNFWGGPTYTSREQWYEQLPNNGSQDHVAFDALDTDGARALIRERLAWNAQGGGEIISEARALSVQVLDDATWVLGWSTAMTNVTDAALRLGSPTTEGRENAGYGGLFWRGPRSFNDGIVMVPSGIKDAEEVRSERHEWLAFVGKHDGDDAQSTVVFTDPGDNPGGVAPWFVRSNIFGCVCPAPFFHEEISVEPGATVTFRYGVAIADGGSDPDRAAALAAAARVGVEATA